LVYAKKHYFGPREKKRDHFGQGQTSASDKDIRVINCKIFV
jgi:hypothetical protein